MKKGILTFVCFLLTTLIFAEEYPLKKIQEYPQSSNGLIFRKMENMDPADDYSMNYLIFDKEGNMSIYQDETSTMFKTNKDFTLGKAIKFDFPVAPYDFKTTDNYYLMNDKSGRIYLFDNQWNLQANVETFSLLDIYRSGLWLGEAFYDESLDVLLFRDQELQVFSIENFVREYKNYLSNFKNQKQSIEMFQKEPYISRISYEKDKNYPNQDILKLKIDEKLVRWSNVSEVGNYFYIINREKDYVNIFVNDNTGFKAHYVLPNGQELESGAVHPNGDCYLLAMDWNAKKHVLYCIENTWDVEWRKQWNDAAASGPASYNVAVNRIMQPNDNLRLRKQESTSSEIITTMLKGTKVKILQLGSEETIDGIRSCWVQVEVLAGGKDKNGKEIKEGTIGWCYGGFLE